jgi:hypothetical protein
MKRTLFLTTLLVLTLFLASCITQPNDPGDALNQEARSDFEVIVNPENSFEEKATKSMTRNPNEIENYYVNYIGRTTPVTINSTNTLTDEWEENIRVAANNVIIKEKEEKKYAFITYNTADNNLQGAIQVVDVTDPLNPVVIVEVHARMIKINAIEYNKEKNEMIFGGTDNYEGTFIRKFNIDEILTNGKEAISDPVYFSKMSLLSDVENLGTVTSVKYYNGNYYVSIGNYGGIVKLDDDFNFVNFKAKDFIKDLEIYNSILFGLVSKNSNGEKGKIIEITENLDLEDISEITLNPNDQSKAELAITERTLEKTWGPWTLNKFDVNLYLSSLSDEGYEMSYEIEDKSYNHLDDSKSVNSIAYDEGLMFKTINSPNGTGFDISEIRFNVDEQEFEVNKLGEHFYSTSLEGLWITNASSNDSDYLVMKNRIVRGEKQNLGLLINAAGEEGALFYYVQNENATYSSEIDLNSIQSIIDSNTAQNFQLKVKNNENISYLNETIRFDFIYVYANGASSNDFGYIKYDSPSLETTDAATSQEIFTKYTNNHYSAKDTFTKEITLNGEYFGFINNVSRGGNQTFSNVNSLNSDDSTDRIVFIYDELGNDGKGQLIVASEDWKDNDYNEPIIIFRTRDHDFKDIFSFENITDVEVQIDLKIE